MNFVNPTVLGSPETFRNVYAKPIMRGRDLHASKRDRDLGESRARELSTLTSKFILRRTSEVLRNSLPPKHEHVIFCKMTETQIRAYNNLLRDSDLLKAMRSQALSLSLITKLKKICNHPSLGDRKSSSSEKENEQNQHTDKFFELSGKIRFLQIFLKQLRKSGDRVVLVSNYTQTLDLLENLCITNKYPFLRLDGSTQTSTRQNLVNRFNSPSSDSFVFLLSSKAGGCGLNLIGGNHLFLFDPDWNPAIDDQAMARIWRDGQLKTTFIYRLISTGTIEEKIYQRQIAKGEVASAIMRETNASKTKRGTDAKRHFNASDLRELFYVVNERTKCASADLLSKADSRWSSTHEPCEDATVLDFTMKTCPDLVTFLHIVQKEIDDTDITAVTENKALEEGSIGVVNIVDDDENEWVCG